MKKFISGLVLGIVLSTISFSFSATQIKEAYYNSDIKIRVNGQYVQTTPITVIDEGQQYGKNYTPARDIVEAMGGTVYWNGDTKTIDVVSAVPKVETVSTEDRIKEIAKKAESVLLVYVDKGSGSAFIVGDGRTALTNFHVVEGKNLAICNADNQPDSGYLYEVIKTDKTNDLAVIKSKYDMYISYNPLTLGDSDKVEIGDTVIAIGSPLGLKNTVSDGIVSGFRTIDGIEYIQITAPISPGSSGGALFNMDGEVIGITTAAFLEGQNLNLAIPINKAKELLK